MRVGLGQFDAGSDKEANLRRMEELADLATAARADLLVLPEAAMAVIPPDAGLAGWAEPLDGPFVQGLGAIARRRRMAVAAGIFEQGPEGRSYNTVVVLGRDGDLIGSYRKIHLYDAFGDRESARTEPGDGRTLVFDLDGLRIGVMTCYELRFPEMARRLVAQGAQLLLLPAHWVRGPLKEHHWTALAHARAIENTVYVAACGMVSERAAGISTLVDPMGVALVSLGEREGVAVGEVEPERVAQVRVRNPSLANRRPDIYAEWAAEEVQRV
ncbi:MAG TPA: carbon-nitrogen hydrolase family protein [Candidatus Dormibacteraeota bacterium]|jgi:predicted amidohydrolase|nr:carbon-nitrogen hydrolase family protein [Candidatus Dormibacteraeota bacterium]